MNDLDFRDARVLIIDDQEMNIAMLSGMLKKHGFRQRFSANDPFAGIEMFQRNSMLAQPLDDHVRSSRC